MGAVALVIPKSLRPEVTTKIERGTEALFGAGSYVPGRWDEPDRLEASNVYGLAGEAMLNFGVVAVPFSFIALGAIIGLGRRWMYSWESNDARRLILPFLIITLGFSVLVSDLDNVVFNFIKAGSLPILLVTMGCERAHQSRTPLGDASLLATPSPTPRWADQNGPFTKFNIV